MIIEMELKRNIFRLGDLSEQAPREAVLAVPVYLHLARSNDIHPRANHQRSGELCQTYDNQ
jgi:hypothetical protein